jgi:hypothetical protein
MFFQVKKLYHHDIPRGLPVRLGNVKVDSKPVALEGFMRQLNAKSQTSN